MSFCEQYLIKATKDDALHGIIDMGADYDGFDTVGGLKGFIDDLVSIARRALNDEYYYSE